MMLPPTFDGSNLIARLAQGMDVNAICADDGHTPLSCALNELNLIEARLLLEAGADAGYCRANGKTALIDVLERWRGDSPELLLPLIELLLEHGAPTASFTSEGTSALSMACGLGRFDIVARLLAAGAFPEAMGWDGLMLAVLGGSREEVALELECDADISARDFWNASAWHFAVGMGDLEKIEMLYAAGADINAVGAMGQTPLHYAVNSRHVAVVAWLLERGAKIDLQDEEGFTGLMRAVEIDDRQAVRLLLEAGADVHLTDGYRKRAPNWEQGDCCPAVDLEINPHTVQQDIFTYQNAMSLAASRETACLLAGAGANLADMNGELFFEWTGLWANDPKGCCYGHSLTELPDGRLVGIGGATDTWINDEFAIYNDGVVYHGNAHTELLAFNKNQFPPLDFHSATLVGRYIYLIGGLGYEYCRELSHTPVYRLDIQTYEVHRVKTKGPHPGCISRHHAQFFPDEGPAGAIHIWSGSLAAPAGEYGEMTPMIKNEKRFALDLTTLDWRTIKS